MGTTPQDPTTTTTRVAARPQLLSELVKYFRFWETKKGWGINPKAPTKTRVAARPQLQSEFAKYLRLWKTKKKSGA